jgi:hypothetical protein
MRFHPAVLFHRYITMEVCAKLFGSRIRKGPHSFAATDRKLEASRTSVRILKFQFA